MPTRIVKYLDEMDVLRGEVEVDIDELMAKINIRPMLNSPGKSADMFKKIIFEYLFSAKTKKIIALARLEGVKLAATL